MRLLERHYDQLFGALLRPEDFGRLAVCVDITAAATDFFLGNSQEYWDARAHFGSLAGPPLGWYEYAPPAQLRGPAGLRRLRPAQLTSAEARIGYRVTRLPVEPHNRRFVLRDDPLPQLIYSLCGGARTAPGTADQRQQGLRRWRRTGVAVQTMLLCEVVAGNTPIGLLSALFGLYLDAQDKPLPELLVAALPAPLSELGPDAQVALCPLFYALSALNSRTAYLQPAASSPDVTGQLATLPFAEVVMRETRVPTVSQN